MKLSEAETLFYVSMKGVLSDKTIRFYEDRLPSLVNFLGDPEVEIVTIHNLRYWRASLFDKKVRYENHPSRPVLDGGLSKFTIHQYVRAARRFFNWMFEEHISTENVAKHLELPQLPSYKPRGIPEKDRDLMIASCQNNSRDYAIILFLSDTACRVGGVSHIKLNDINLDKCQAVVKEKGRGGNENSRIVFFGEKTANALLDYLEERPNVHGCDYLFLGCKNGKYGRLTESGVYEMLERAAARVGVTENSNPHSFRHGAIRGMLSNGLSLPEVSQIAGHSSTRVTGDIYGVFDENHLSDRHRKFSWIR